MRFLFAQNTFGYTLFNNKPISFCFIPSGISYWRLPCGNFQIYKVGDHAYFKGASLLNEWIKSHPGKNHVLRVFHNQSKPGFAVIINKEAVEKVFNENIDLFRNHFSKDLTIQQLIDMLEKQETYFNDLFDEHIILGILLGYGRLNAELFEQRRVLLQSEISIPMTQKLIPNKKRRKQELTIHPQKDLWTSIVTPVHFISDPKFQETQTLKGEYSKCHKKLTEIFKQENWIETILDQLGCVEKSSQRN